MIQIYSYAFTHKLLIKNNFKLINYDYYMSVCSNVIECCEVILQITYWYEWKLIHTDNVINLDNVME